MGGPISTRDLLKSLGFREDKSVISDPPGGLSYDFGIFTLSAGLSLNRWFKPVMHCWGVYSSPRTIMGVDFEMPRDVETREQGIAWVTWCLDHHFDGRSVPRLSAPWLALGRTYFHLLPWEIERAAYATRPRCQASREWVRLALRDLAALVSNADDDQPVIVQFDGEVVRIRCGDDVVIVPAAGESWTSRYALKAGALRELPKRLMSEVVQFEIWDGALVIDGRRYKGVSELAADGET